MGLKNSKPKKLFDLNKNYKTIYLFHLESIINLKKIMSFIILKIIIIIFCIIM